MIGREARIVGQDGPEFREHETVYVVARPPFRDEARAEMFERLSRACLFGASAFLR